MQDTGSASLYQAWFDSPPQMFRAMMPTNAAGWFTMPGAAQPSARQLPFPMVHVGQALQTTAALLAQLYQAYLPLLSQGGLSVETINALARSASETYQRLQQTIASTNAAIPDMQSVASLQELMKPWQGLLGPLRSTHASEAQKVLQLGMERTLGGLSDAVGLGPMRALDDAFREMASANIERNRAQLEYLALWVQSWNEGTQALVRELIAKAGRGERVESVLALLRLWAKSVDGSVHRIMQSERGLSVTAKAIRAATIQREHVQKAVALMSEALNVPTRAEVDEAYREIQELKRELRQLRKSLGHSAPQAMRAGAAAPATAASSPAGRGTPPSRAGSGRKRAKSARAKDQATKEAGA